MKIQAGQFTVNELCLAFLRHAETYYVKDGRQTEEIPCLKSAIRALVDLYGHTTVNEFGPLSLKALRERMVKKCWSRKYVNNAVSRLRHVFRCEPRMSKVEQVFQRVESRFSMTLKIEGEKSQSIISSKVREGGSAAESKLHSNSARS